MNSVEPLEELTWRPLRDDEFIRARSMAASFLKSVSQAYRDASIALQAMVTRLISDQSLELASLYRAFSPDRCEPPCIFHEVLMQGSTPIADMMIRMEPESVTDVSLRIRMVASVHLRELNADRGIDQ